MISFFSSRDRGFAVLAGGVMGIVAIPLPFPSAAVHLPDLEAGVDVDVDVDALDMDRMPPTGLTLTQQVAEKKQVTETTSTNATVT